jgi:hypothetical protein
MKIILGAVVIISLFLILTVWLISKGLRNKFGAESLPELLNLHFDPHISYENKKLLRFDFDEASAVLVENGIKRNINDKDTVKNPFLQTDWHCISEGIYECRIEQTNKIIATFDVVKGQLTYFKSKR